MCSIYICFSQLQQDVTGAKRSRANSVAAQGALHRPCCYVSPLERTSTSIPVRLLWQSKRRAGAVRYRSKQQPVGGGGYYYVVVRQARYFWFADLIFDFAPSRPGTETARRPCLSRATGSKPRCDSLPCGVTRGHVQRTPESPLLKEWSVEKKQLS